MSGGTLGEVRAQPRPLSEIVPGPAAPAAAQTLAWTARPVPFMHRCRAEHGNVFRVHLAEAGEVVFVAEPELIKRIFTADPGVLRAGEGNAVLEPVVGSRSVLLLDGPAHLRARRLMLPPFHGERMTAYGELMTRIAEQAVERWPAGEPFPLQPAFQDITLEIILRAIFGVSEPERSEPLRAALLRMLNWGMRPLSLLPWLRRDFPGSPWRRFSAALAEVDALLYAEIARRRASDDLAERDDILSLMLLARDEDGEPLADAELRDELVTLLVAGHETTATALSWAFERMLRTPATLERLAAECRDEDAGDEYAEAVVRETLRIRPPLPIVVRRLSEPWELREGEGPLPEGIRVAPCIYLTHHREDLYPDPFAFRPERFLGVKPDTYAWLPFGGGIRRCLGAAFAQFEMKAVMKAVLRSADLEAADHDTEPVHRRAIVLAPRRGSRAVLRGRRPAAAPSGRVAATA